MANNVTKPTQLACQKSFSTAFIAALIWLVYYYHHHKHNTSYRTIVLNSFPQIYPADTNTL